MHVLLAVTLVILLAAAAFSVDTAYMFLAREQLHVATDAAAKAAVVALAQGGNQTTATNTAISYAAANSVCGSPLTITSSNVTLGKVTYSSSGLWAFSAGGTPTTAAQVTGTASTPLFFAPALGRKTFSASRTSTAAFVRNKWCFVFDRSGSMCFDMSGTDWSYPPPVGYLSNRYPSSPYVPNATLSRLANLVTGANTFLTTLTSSPGGVSQNQVGMVTFADSASTDCTFTTTYSTITTKLNYYLTTNIYSDGIYNGGTNLYSGLQAAINLFSSTDDGTPWNKVIIVFSDGQWNQGSDPLNLVSTATNAGIVIHTIGLLSGGSNTTMQNLASQTGGLYLTVTNTAAVQAAFIKLAETIPVLLTQ
jgi:Flp pilus assembly protein TadG